MEKLFNAFQIIMLSLLFLTLLVRTTILYFKDGIFPFVLGKGKKGFNAFLEIIFFIALLVWSYEIILHILNLKYHIVPIFFINKILVDNNIIKFIGSALILTGYIIFIFSLIAFGKSWRVGIDKESPGKLIKDGIFSITRNPIYLFLDLYFIGTAFLNTNLFFIICSVLVLFGMHYQILQEEKFLKENYGQEYIGYSEKVRRYL